MLAFIGIGSNLGVSRSLNLDKAILSLRRSNKIKLLDTSRLYESRPTEFGQVVSTAKQPNYYNCVIKVKTNLPPLALLAVLKTVEADLGRDFSTRRHGPRIVDLDLLFMSDERAEHDELACSMIFKNDTLEIPHPRMLQRDFVMEPLGEITGLKTQQRLIQLKNDSAKSLLGIVATYGPNLEWLMGTTCHRLAILNATPDSFSDGGSLTDATTRATQVLAMGASALDVGGESTRPGADKVDAEQEWSRVEPILKSISSICRVVSIDTYKVEVAKRALDAGATVVNDVTGGADPKMLDLVGSRPGTGLVVMHSRGDSKSMDLLTREFEGQDIVEVVGNDLESKVKSAIAFGIPRWRIMVDPGIGFAKKHDDSLKLLTSSNALKKRLGVPVMIGHSRKRFLKPTLLKIPVTQEWPSDDVRNQINEKATQMAIETGADMVRIHY